MLTSPVDFSTLQAESCVPAFWLQLSSTSVVQPSVQICVPCLSLALLLHAGCMTALQSGGLALEWSTSPASISGTGESKRYPHTGGIACLSLSMTLRDPAWLSSQGPRPAMRLLPHGFACTFIMMVEAVALSVKRSNNFS